MDAAVCRESLVFSPVKLSPDSRSIIENAPEGREIGNCAT